jgi:hypothetical protein
MTIFDLLFLLAALASIMTLALAVFSVIRGRRARAIRILWVYAVCGLLYLVAGVTAGLVRPQRVIPAGVPWCFDDRCITVQSVNRTAGHADISYDVGLRIFSRAGRVAQRANGAWLYLIDGRGHRYSPDPDTSGVPLDVLLLPNQSVTTSRTFHVPSNVGALGLVTGHGGPYCGPMSFLVIGESGCLFRKPTMIRIE